MDHCVDFRSHYDTIFVAIAEMTTKIFKSYKFCKKKLVLLHRRKPLKVNLSPNFHLWSRSLNFRSKVDQAGRSGELKSRWWGW